MAREYCQRLVLRGPLRSSGQNKGRAVWEEGMCMQAAHALHQPPSI